MQPSPDISPLIADLVEAQRRRTRTLDPARYAALDRATAYAVELGVLAALGQPVGMLKTAVHADGVGVVAPIYAASVGRAPDFRLPVATTVGLEVELGIVLGKDIPASTAVDAAQVAAAVDHYFLGVEIVGTRFTDRSAAGPMGGLADNMSSYGYVIGPDWTWTGEPNGLDLRLSFAGAEIYAAPAKHGFGTVLASVVAYARSQKPELPLTAGTIVTTGSLCGLVPASGTGHVVARLGHQALEFDIV